MANGRCCGVCIFLQIYDLIDNGVTDLPTVLEVNIGKFCNLTCQNCHVELGPTKTRENMVLKTRNSGLLRLDRVTDH